MILGDLEKRVLHYLWEVAEADAKQVHGALTKGAGGALNTIQSALERLFRKGLLARHKRGHAYYYCSRIAREELIANMIQEVTGDFINDGDDTLIAAFSSFSAGLDDAELLRLERLIQEQRKRQKRKTNDAS